MPEFSAALFATQKRPHGQEHRLIAHALLFEGSKPYWEIHIGGKIFSFIADPHFLLEDGLWQLHAYCHIPESEYKHDVSGNESITLEEEFGKEICKESRDNIINDLRESDIHIKLVQWPGFWMNKWNEKIQAMQDKGAAFTVHS